MDDGRLPLERLGRALGLQSDGSIWGPPRGVEARRRAARPVGAPPRSPSIRVAPVRPSRESSVLAAVESLEASASDRLPPSLREEVRRICLTARDLAPLLGRAGADVAPHLLTLTAAALEHLLEAACQEEAASLVAHGAFLREKYGPRLTWSAS